MTTGLSYLAAGEKLDSLGPILVAATDDAARCTATHWLEQSGWRAVGIPIEGAVERMALQASASGLWIEVGGNDSGEALDQLLNFANGAAAAHRMPTIVAAPTTMIDPVAARLSAAHTQLLIDPSPAERTTAVALARFDFDAPATLHDVAQGARVAPPQAIERRGRSHRGNACALVDRPRRRGHADRAARQPE